MKKSRFSNILWGSLFLAAAGVIVLHLLGLLGDMGIWTLLVSIPLVISVIHSLTRLEWAGTFYSLAALIFIHRHTIENAIDIRFHFWALFGIATLLTIGFYVLFGKVKRVDKFAWTIDGADVTDSSSYEESAEGEKVHFTSRFNGTSKYVHSQNLCYLSLQNEFSGMEIYFENAKLSPNGAIVEIKNNFGGIELFVPKDWNVIDNMNNFLAGTDVKSRKQIEGAPTLTLRGTNNFGGIDVVFV